MCVLGLMRREVSERKKERGRRASRDRGQRKELERERERERVYLHVVEPDCSWEVPQSRACSHWYNSCVWWPRNIDYPSTYVRPKGPSKKLHAYTDTHTHTTTASILSFNVTCRIMTCRVVVYFLLLVHAGDESVNQDLVLPYQRGPQTAKSVLGLR